MSTVHVVTGAGPVGSTVAQQLADAGHRVRLLTRSGSGPEHPLIERRRVDVSRPDALTEAFEDAVAVHHCIHGSAYDARVWQAELPRAERAVLEAAGRTGAVVVFPESLYSYGPVDGPMTEDLPRTATGGKLGVRTELLAQRDASATPTVSVAASDFYGPLVKMAHAGERLVPTVLAGRTMRVLGSLDQPHSYTYVPDLAAAMVTAASRPDLWNSFLHAPTAPALTQRRLVELVAAAGDVPVPRMSALPAPVLRALGTVSRDMRELAETSYMFARPFVLDSTASEQRLGLAPTPLESGIKATVGWWRAQEGPTH
ncbi:MAG TPA: NAD-dependent epimerase/dehydratase family protein [Nocardioides sp.]|nr:NAD-dependent epimerase/dehydratase family protein [Nocardioides sp.]